MAEENGAGTGTALVQRAEHTAKSTSAFGGGAEAFNTAQRIARALSESTVVPKEYQGNLPNVLVAMELANRIGASVLAVMQNVDVIHGRPSLRATFLIATVNASGRFSPLRFRWEGAEGKDDWGCRAIATDRESGEECVGALINIALAKLEGWHGKSGSKWKTMPEQMLMYRSASFWARVYCPELSLGMHTAEEVEDVTPSGADRTESLAAGLDAPDPEPVDDSPASDAQIKQLKGLLPKARDGEVLNSDDEEWIAEALEQEDGPRVRGWIRELQILLARGQASLGVEA